MIVHVYMLTNKTNGKQYVGITKRGIDTRWRAHRRVIVKGKIAIKRFAKHPLYVDLRDHGHEGFKVECLAVTECLQEAGKLEAEFVAAKNCIDPNGYNRQPGGVRGYAAGKRSDEFRAACRARAKKQFSDPAQRERVRLEQLARWQDPATADAYNSGRERAYKERPELLEMHLQSLVKARAANRHLGGWKMSPDAVKAMSERALANSASMSERAKIVWNDPVKRENLLRSRRAARLREVSTEIA